jgi:hypothetical protein
LNLLDKINAVEINDTDVLALHFNNTVLTFCKEEEKDYLDTLHSLNRSLHTIGKERHVHVNKYSTQRYPRLVSDTEEYITTCHSEFISTLVDKVNKEYNTNLSSTKVKISLLKGRISFGSFAPEYVPDFELTYEKVLHTLKEQLEGLSLEERSFNELKETFTGKFLYKNNTLSKNKLTVGAGGLIGRGYYSDSLRIYEEKLRYLLDSLTYFERGDQDSPSYLIDNLVGGANSRDCLKKQGLPFNKVTHYKPFIKGKVEVWFDSNASALEFCNMFDIKLS